VSREVVHDHNLSRAQVWQEDLLQIGLERLGVDRAYAMAAEGPMPSTSMLASKVVFLPRLRGTEQ
jgi:hypothetical protein